MTYRQLLSSKLVALALGIFLLFLLSLKYQQWKNQRNIEKQQQALVAQINGLSQQNDQLSQSISYYNSSSYKERVARQQLNLEKNGEQAYTFTQSTATSAPASAQSGGKSNFEKWVDYFSSSN